MSVASTPGEGSTFTLLLPTGDLSGVKMVCDPAESAYAADAIRGVCTQDLAGVSVLLADDGADNRQLIGFLLRKAVLTVGIAENGRLAVARALSCPFDVVLMDVQMPEMDGLQAMRVLREQGYQRPILALTGARHGERSRALPRPAAACI